MTPFRLLIGVYVAVFLLAAVAMFGGNLTFVRVTWCALGLLLAIYGVGLLTNIGNIAADAAAKVGKSKWLPPVMAEPWFPRVIGPFFLVVGLLFAWQAVAIDKGDLQSTTEDSPRSSSERQPG